MAIIKRLSVEIEPSVSDVLAIISLVKSFHPGNEVKFLEAIVLETEMKIKEINKDSDTNAE